MKYLLDTNAAGDWLRGEAKTAARNRRARPADLAVSAVTAMELRYGAEKRGSNKLAKVKGLRTVNWR